MEEKIDNRVAGILKVAAPIALGTFVQFIVLFTDNLFLAQLSEGHMNASGNAGLAYVSLMMIIVGITSGVQIMVARRIGENAFQEAGQTLRTGLRLALITGLVLLGICQLLNFGLFPTFIQDPLLLERMQDFFGIRQLGFVCYPAAATILGFYMGAARTRILIYTTLLMALVNIGLDYVLIFGKLGFPDLGIKGAAWATVSSELLATGFVVVYAFKDRYFQKCWVKPERVKPVLKRLVSISAPIAVQQFAALATFTAFFFLIERMGESALNTSHIIRNMYMLIFVSMMGIGQATKTYISTLVAEGRQAELKPTIKRLLLLNIGGWVLMSHGLWLYPESIVRVFTHDPETVENTVLSMRVVLVAMFLACFSSVFLNVIEGSGKTRVAMIIELMATVLFVVNAYLLTRVWPQPIQWIWMNDWLYFGFIASASLFYLWRRPWQNHQI